MSASRTVTELLSLRGKAALITGGAGHLGFPMAEALAEAGASVVMCGRELARAEAAAARLPRLDGVRHHAVVLDHMDEASILRGFQQAEDRAGRIDVLVNNAHEPTTADWAAVTAEQFDRQFLNGTGYFLLARRFRDHAAPRGGGSIVMIGSMYGVVGSYPEDYERGAASPVAYHALKGALVQITRHLAVYWAADGVRVNCLSPGPFPGEAAPPAVIDRLKRRSPMGRMGRPDELKGAVVFLASDAASYVTGQNLLVDGGWTAW